MKLLKLTKMPHIKIKLFFLTLVISTLVSGVFVAPHLSRAQTASQITLSAFILENKNRALLNGDYTVRFALYAQEEGGSPVWQETQTTPIKNGSMRASLGQSTPLQSLDVQNTTYYLGITLNADSEMSPRVKIGSAFSALNAQTLQGKTIGTNGGDIATLDANAKFDKKLIPKISKVGTITIGTWEGEKIAPGFLTNTFPSLAIGDGTPSSIDEDNDLYITDDLEVDGTIFGDVSGTFTGTVSPGFTQGSVVFADSAGALAQNNANFFWDDTNNRLGIGTTSPNAALTIAGSITPSADDTHTLGSTSYRWSDLYIGPSTVHIGTSATDEGTLSYDTTSNILNIGTDATGNGDIAFFTDDLYLDKSTGYVGIGTTASGYPLHVVHSIGDGGTLAKFERTGGEADLSITSIGGVALQLTTDGNLQLSSASASLTHSGYNTGIKDTTPDAILEVSSGGLSGMNVFNVSSDNDADGDLFVITNPLSSTGFVGIGTTSPLLKLDVAGSGRFTGAATSVLTGSIDAAASTAVVGAGTLFTTQ